MSIIEISNLYFRYENTDDLVLKGINLNIEKGQSIAIVGHNGSGKSTLAKLINGLIMPTEGEVRVLGTLTSDEKNLFEIRKNAGMVFQNPDNQMVAAIVENDVAFGPENIGLPREEIGERIDYALKAVDMERFRHSTPTKLSGGQKQRIAIAGVLALKPEIIILDESTSMLDPKGRREILSYVYDLQKKEGKTIINITHYMDEAVKADRIIVINHGEVLLDGTPKEVFSQSDKLIEAGIILPRQIQIKNALKERGISLSDDAVTEQEIIAELCKLLAKK